MGSYAYWYKANQFTHHFKLYPKNHNNPSDKVANLLMIKWQMPTKASN